MKVLTVLFGLLGIVSQSYAQHSGHSMPHEMQHGFVLSADDKFASHLVATGHHSRQTEITGQLLIDDQQEEEFYQERKLQSSGRSYFLFQAQQLDLPTLSHGQKLVGHIVESKIGAYEPKNIIVRSATFKVEKVPINIPNPFFIEEAQGSSFRPLQVSPEQPSICLSGLVNSIKPPRRHCCDTGEKPCNWKCQKF
ncbi:MAG: hypothetical protein IPK04_05125 [Bdellovibrionales bacterium]|jgi:hypothetical protein|nr:hypothetical protein [Bdellovibrionales bacterium]